MPYTIKFYVDDAYKTYQMNLETWQDGECVDLTVLSGDPVDTQPFVLTALFDAIITKVSLTNPFPE